jgi:hypothetical protein
MKIKTTKLLVLTVLTVLSVAIQAAELLKGSLFR